MTVENPQFCPLFSHKLFRCFSHFLFGVDILRRYPGDRRLFKRIRWSFVDQSGIDFSSSLIRDACFSVKVGVDHITPFFCVFELRI